MIFSTCVRDAIRKRHGSLWRFWHVERPWTTLLAERSERGAPFSRLASTSRAASTCAFRSSPAPRRPWDDLLDDIAQQRGIESFRVHRWPDGLEVDYDPSRLNRDDVLAAASSAWVPVTRDTERDGGVRRNWPSPRQSEFMVRGPRRLFYLALGCGSLVMTFVGLVVPGIPTVPFLLASSYYLARSSRTLHKRLLESRLLGEVLREWETHRAMSLRSKWKLTGITLVVVLITVLLAPLSPVVILVVAAMVSLTLAGLYKIPTVEPCADFNFPPAHESRTCFGSRPRFRTSGDRRSVAPPGVVVVNAVELGRREAAEIVFRIGRFFRVLAQVAFPLPPPALAAGALDLALHLPQFAFRGFHGSSHPHRPASRSSDRARRQDPERIGKDQVRIPAYGAPPDIRSHFGPSSPDLGSNRAFVALSTIRSWPASINKAGCLTRRRLHFTSRSMKELAAIKPAVACRRL